MYLRKVKLVPTYSRQTPREDFFPPIPQVSRYLAGAKQPKGGFRKNKYYGNRKVERGETA
jgi:hypothetical protein